jgi:hypothetical protein
MFQHLFAIKTPTAIFNHSVFPDSSTTFPGLHLAITHLQLGSFFEDIIHIIHIIFTISVTSPLKDTPNAKDIFTFIKSWFI